jgi:hypothetical protein
MDFKAGEVGVELRAVCKGEELILSPNRLDCSIVVAVKSERFQTGKGERIEESANMK